MRRRLEDYFIRNAAGVVDEIGEDRGGRLADALGELEQRSVTVAAAEAKAAELDRRVARFGPAYEDERSQVEHLLHELEAREAELVRLRPHVEELEAELAGEREEAERRAAALADATRRYEAQERWVDDLRARVERGEAARKRAEELLRKAESGERQRARSALELGQERRALAEREAAVRRAEEQLAALRARLEHKERELARYVGQVQTTFRRHPGDPSA